MTMRSTIEILSLVAGIALVAQTFAQRQGGYPRAREVDNVTLMAPVSKNYLADREVQAQVRRVAAAGPYKDYNSWMTADPRYRGGL